MIALISTKLGVVRGDRGRGGAQDPLTTALLLIVQSMRAKTIAAQKQLIDTCMGTLGVVRSDRGRGGVQDPLSANYLSIQQVDTHQSINTTIQY